MVKNHNPDVDDVGLMEQEIHDKSAGSRRTNLPTLFERQLTEFIRLTARRFSLYFAAAVDSTGGPGSDGGNIVLKVCERNWMSPLVVLLPVRQRRHPLLPWWRLLQIGKSSGISVTPLTRRCYWSLSFRAGLAMQGSCCPTTDSCRFEQLLPVRL